MRSLLISDLSCRLAAGLFVPSLTKICWRHTPPLRLLLANFFTLATNPGFFSPQTIPSVCPCQSFLAFGAPSFDGHVVISDAKLLPPNLQYLFTLGMQYRPGSSGIDTTDILIDAFQRFAHKTSPQGGLTDWFNAMRAKLLNGQDYLVTVQRSRSSVASSLSNALQEAKAWSKVFTIIPADKLKHNLVAVCSVHYAASLKS